MFEEQIAKGMKFLDETVPGWEHKIDLNKLDVSDCNNCVVGQLFTSSMRDFSEERGFEMPIEYRRSMYVLGPFKLDRTMDLPGFYSPLTQEWKTAIQNRLTPPMDEISKAFNQMICEPEEVMAYVTAK